MGFLAVLRDAKMPRDGQQIPVLGRHIPQVTQLINWWFGARFGDVNPWFLWTVSGCGSKLSRWGYAGFGPCFHLPGFNVPFRASVFFEPPPGGGLPLTATKPPIRHSGARLPAAGLVLVRARLPRGVRVRGAENRRPVSHGR